MERRVRYSRLGGAISAKKPRTNASTGFWLRPAIANHRRSASRRGRRTGVAMYLTGGFVRVTTQLLTGSRDRDLVA